MKERMKRGFNKIIHMKLNGVGVIEIILILVILISLVLLFREQITEIVTQAFDAITGDSTEIIDQRK